MGYTRQVANGLSWVGLLRLSIRFVAFCKTAVLARLLNPAQFGVFGIASLILGLLEMITETGINIFLVQEKRDDSVEHYLHTAWIVSLVRGLIIALIVFVSAPFLANFFNSPESRLIIQLIAFVPLIRGSINPAVAMFQKQLKFKQEYWFRLTVAAVESGVAITFSLLLHSSISLVIGMLAGSLIETLISHIFIKPKPKLLFELDKWNTIIRRGKWVTSAGILTYAISQGPAFVVGKLLGSASLGFFTMASSLSLLFATEITDMFNRVTFPVFVKIIDDKHRCLKAFIKNSLVISGLLLPITAIFYLFPEFILHLVLGDQWLSVASLVQLLVTFGFIATIASAASPLILAAKHQDYLSHMNLIQLFFVVISIYPFVHNFGINGAGYSLIISALLILPVKGWFVYKVLDDIKPSNEPTITPISEVI